MSERIIRAQLLFLLTAFGVAFAQSPAQIVVHHKMRTAVEQSTYAPYWTTEAGWTTELQLRNNRFDIPVSITPVLVESSGKELRLKTVEVAIDSVSTLALHELIQISGFAALSSFGYLRFEYKAASSANVYASVLVHRSGQPITFHLDALPIDGSFTSGSRETLWWLPFASTTGTIILVNTDSKPTTVSIELSTPGGSSFLENIELGKGAFQRVSINELVRKHGIQHQYGGITVKSSGPLGALQLASFSWDESHGICCLAEGL